MWIFNFWKFNIKHRNLITYKGKSDKVVIPGYVLGINSLAFSNSDVKNIVVKEGVKNLDNNCFAQAKKLEFVSLPHSIEKIGVGIFSKDAALEKVELPNKLKSIPINTFNGCFNLKNVHLPLELIKIESRAFYNCHNLDELIFPIYLNSIESEAFKGCCNLTNVMLKATEVERLEREAFSGCIQLKRVILNRGLKVIESEAFYNCRKLLNIELPDKLIAIGDRAFAKSGIGEIIIPESIQELGKGVFANCNNLKKVVLPRGLKSIDASCFASCQDLEFIDLPINLKELGVEALTHCSKLQEITIPWKINVIKNGTFSFCSNLKKIDFKNNNIVIEDRAFTDCESLQEIIYKGQKINVRNITIKFLNNDVLDYLLENKDKIESIRAKIPFEALIELQEMNLLDDFCKNAYFKNYRNLYNRIFEDKIGDLIGKSTLFNLSYIMGVFDKDLSQKSSELLNELVDNKLLTMGKVYRFVGNITLKEIDEEMIRTITDRRISFFNDICLQSKVEDGFIGKCLENYKLVQSSHTTNKGSHRTLKPTLEKFVNYFSIDKFNGIMDDRDMDIAIEIGKFFDDNSTFEKAKKVFNDFKEKRIPNSLISEDLRVEPYERITLSKKRFLANSMESKKILKELHYEFLKKDDPLNLTIGKYCSSCCGHIEGLGEGICFASVLDPLTQTIIANSFNEIFSKATFSINKETESMVINSIQVNSSLAIGNGEKIVSKYMDAIKLFVSDYNKLNDNKINRVYLGINKSLLLDYFNGEENGFSPSLDYSKYGIDHFHPGDWQKGQLCIYDIKKDFKK